MEVMEGLGDGPSTACRVIPALRAAPFRPGEMPVIVMLNLHREARGRIVGLASRSSLPVELVLRVAVEAARHLAHAARLLGVRAGVLENVLDDAASHRNVIVPIHGARLAAYAEAIRGAASLQAGHREPPLGKSVRLPETVWTGWCREAACAGTKPDDWVSDMLIEAPAGSAVWEAAAAEAGLSQGEWIWKSAATRH